MKVILLIMMIGLMLVPYASAQEASEYYMIIEDNGNALVSVTITGSGLYSIPIPSDVDDILVRGALYILNGDHIDVSIGETEQAVILYTSSMHTSKTGDEWRFTMDLGDLENMSITVLMPEDTNIISTTPEAFIQSGEVTEVYWSDAETIEIVYQFEKGIESQWDWKPFYLIGAVIVIAGAGYIYSRRNPHISKKESVIKTLSENEKKIVHVLIENKGIMKRSKVEKSTGISKSSLAVSLKNLEKKKILIIDKTYPVHSVKLTEWFNGL